MILPYDSTELDMGDVQVLEGFVNYLCSFDAEMKKLILWGHGRGKEGICFDGRSELDALDIQYGLGNHEIDLLILDACEMMVLEVFLLYTIQSNSFSDLKRISLIEV